VHPAVALRYPFLTLEQAAYFLGISREDAQRLYEADELPKALRADGGVFEPTPAQTLVPYLEFAAGVADEVRHELEAWQAGKFKLPAKPRGERSSRAIARVKRSERPC
jgi:hypothetical protein